MNRLGARPTTETELLRIKAATRELTRGNGGLEAAARLTRVDFAHLSRYQLQHDGLFIPADIVADLERAAGDLPVTRVLADLNGHLLVPKPPAFGNPLFVSHLAQVSKECGEAIGALGEALSNDGEITAEESRALRLRTQVREAIDKLAALDKALEAIEQASPQKGPVRR